MIVAQAAPGPDLLDLRSIRYLVAIVEEGSLAAAARRLGVTQSALSRSVQSDERKLGVRLLDRGKHGALPTAMGKLVVEKGRHLLSDSRALIQEIDLLRGAEGGEIRIGAGPYPADLSVGTAVGRLLAQKPRLKVTVAVGDWPVLTARVLEGSLDIAVCELEATTGNPQLAVEPLPSHRGVLFCRAGHPLAARKTVTLESVRGYPLALTALPPRLALLLADQGGTATRTASPAVHVDTFSLARAVVLASDVIGGAVATQIEDDVREGRIVMLPIKLPWLVTGYGFVYRAGRTLAPSVQLFRSLVRKVEDEATKSDREAPARRR